MKEPYVEGSSDPPSPEATAWRNRGTLTTFLPICLALPRSPTAGRCTLQPELLFVPRSLVTVPMLSPCSHGAVPRPSLIPAVQGRARSRGHGRFGAWGCCSPENRSPRPDLSRGSSRWRTRRLPGHGLAGGGPGPCRRRLLPTPPPIAATARPRRPIDRPSARRSIGSPRRKAHPIPPATSSCNQATSPRGPAGPVPTPRPATTSGRQRDTA